MSAVAAAKRGRPREVTRPEQGSALEQRAAAFTLGAGVPILLAFNDGGFDLVTRQQAGLLLWWGIALALAFGFLPRGRIPGIRGVLGALVALTAWTLLSLLWTDSGERTFEEVARLLTFGAVLVLVLHGLSPRTWIAAAAGLSVAALLIPAMAVLGRLVPELRMPGEFGINLEADRLIYPLGYWNAVAAWSAMAIAIGLAWSVHLRTRVARALCLATVPVSGVACYLCYSRVGIVAAAIAALAVIALSERRWTAAIHTGVATVATVATVLVLRGFDEVANGTGGSGGAVVALVLLVACLGCGFAAEATRRSKVELLEAPRWLRVGAAAAAIAAAAAGLALGPGLASNAVNELRSDTYPGLAADPSDRLVSLASSRPEVWREAVSAFAEDPLTGIGPGTFEFWWAREGEEEYVRDAHSLYLETLAELGIPGALALTALMAGLVAAVLRGRKAAQRSSAIAATTGLGAAFFVYLFCAGVDWMWESTAVTVLALAGAGVAAAAAVKPRARRRRGEPRLLPWQRTVAIALAVIAGAVQIPALVSTERVRASQFRRSIGDLEGARAAAQDSVTAQPWAATGYAERALVELADEDSDAALADAHEAIDREPTNWWHAFLLLRVHIERQDEAAALAALAETRRLRPNIEIDEAAVLDALAEGRADAVGSPEGEG